MATITIKNQNLKVQTERTSLLTRYYAYCDRQKNARMLWFLIPLMSLPAAIMPLSIFAMFYLASYTLYLSFIAISILAFYANLVSTIGEYSIRTSITVYFLTVLFHVLLPIFSFFIF